MQFPMCALGSGLLPICLPLPLGNLTHLSIGKREQMMSSFAVLKRQWCCWLNQGPKKVGAKMLLGCRNDLYFYFNWKWSLGPQLPPLLFPIHSTTSTHPRFAHSLFPLQKWVGLQKRTTKQDQTRYNKTKQEPHIEAGQRNPVGGKESQEQVKSPI